jgi:beta-glucanase (GH16 family)
MRRLLLLPLLVACTRDEAVEPGWELVWQDEFRGDAGTPPDPEKWTYDIGGEGWGNNQLEFNSDRTENVSLDGDGSLRIRAIREDFEGNTWTSARIKTQGLFEQGYGRFAARIKLPLGKGLWPAFWMLGNDIDEFGWPLCGEIDILEARGQEPDVVHGTIHGPGYSGGQSVGGTFPLDPGIDDWHVYTVDWDDGLITWMLDGEVVQRFTRADLPPNALWVYDHEFFMILNLAVGGTFLDDPDETTPDVNDMLVDWVRVSRRITP